MASPEAQIVTDVCVVGGGPAGITVAHELDGCGIGVCLLESGGPELERRVHARLLLAADHGRGLGNEHDLVGRYFAERLSLPVGYVIPSSTGAVDGSAFFDRRDGMSGALRVVDRVQRDNGLLNCAFSLVPKPAAATTAAVRSLSTLRKAVTRRPVVAGAGAHLRTS